MTYQSSFAAWLDNFFTAYYRRRPVNATFIGVHDYDHALPNYSENGMGDALAEAEVLQGRLRYLPDEPLTAAQRLDRVLAEGFLDVQRWERSSRHFEGGNPSHYIGEAVFGVISLLLRPFAPAEQRSAAATARMAALPTLLAQGQANVRHAPTAWTARAIRECDGALAFFEHGVALWARQHGVESAQLQTAAETAAAAVATFRHYLEAELLRHPNEQYACGAEAFGMLLRRGHFLDMDAATVESYALEQIAQCEADLTQRAREFGENDWHAVLAKLADLHPNVEQYYAQYGAVWNACRVAAEQHTLLTWPEYPIHYVPQPEWAREAAPSLYFLFYRAPAPFDQQDVVEYLVTPIEPGMSPEMQQRLLRATNDSVIKLNHVVHHGAIGHHVQNWHAYRAESQIGQIAAVDCASRIAMFCGGTLAEGWACYATDLMAEFGFLTPLEQYAERHGRLRMAARALADVRLHHGTWTLDEAAQFYHERVGMPQAAATAEAVKNSMFPGTALMYLMGTDAIHSLRRDLVAKQGAAFDLRTFHDQFLSYGSVPVALIAKAILAN